jgi:hypothetical protein
MEIKYLGEPEFVGENPRKDGNDRAGSRLG